MIVLKRYLFYVSGCLRWADRRARGRPASNGRVIDSVRNRMWRVGGPLVASQKSKRVSIASFGVPFCSVVLGDNHKSHSPPSLLPWLVIKLPVSGETD